MTRRGKWESATGLIAASSIIVAPWLHLRGCTGVYTTKYFVHSCINIEEGETEPTINDE